MGRRIIGGLIAAALVGAGLVAGTSLAGGGNQRDLAEPVVVSPIVADRTSPAGTVEAAGKKRRAKKPLIQYFYASDFTALEPGQALVQPISCPRGKGEPIAAGGQTTLGVSIVSLSRVLPGTTETPRRTYYVGFEAATDPPAGAGAFAEVQCAKNLKVKATD